MRNLLRRSSREPSNDTELPEGLFDPASGTDGGRVAPAAVERYQVPPRQLSNGRITSNESLREPHTQQRPNRRTPRPDSLEVSRRRIGRGGHHRSSSDSHLRPARQSHQGREWDPQRHGWVIDNDRDARHHEGDEGDQYSPVHQMEIPAQWLLSLNSRDNDRVELPRRQQQILPRYRAGSPPPMLPPTPPRLPQQPRALRASSSQPMRYTDGLLNQNHVSARDRARSGNDRTSRHGPRQSMSMNLPALSPSQMERRTRRHAVLPEWRDNEWEIQRERLANREEELNRREQQAIARSRPRQLPAPPQRPSPPRVSSLSRVLPLPPIWAASPPREPRGRAHRARGTVPEIRAREERHNNRDRRRDGVIQPTRNTGRLIAAEDWYGEGYAATQAVDAPEHADEDYRGHERPIDRVQANVPSPTPAPRRVRRAVLAAFDVPEGYQPYNDVPLNLNAARLDPIVPREIVAAPVQPHPSFFAAVEDGGVHREPVRDEEGVILDGDAPPMYTELAEDVVEQDAYGGDMPPAYVEVEVRSDRYIDVNVRVRGPRSRGDGARVLGDVVDVGAVSGVPGTAPGEGRGRSINAQLTLKNKRSSLPGKLWKGFKGLFKDDAGGRGRDGHGDDSGGLH